uniref:Uncharacterized protein n=1 Tax=Anopheles coluzzii TaxID=1518534 RepID=A0A8W7Q1I4_ANOCL
MQDPEMHLTLVDPADDHVRPVDGAVLGKPQPNVAVGAGLHLERDVLAGDAPQQPVVVVQKDGMIPVSAGNARANAHQGGQRHRQHRREGHSSPAQSHHYLM